MNAALEPPADPRETVYRFLERHGPATMEELRKHTGNGPERTAAILSGLLNDGRAGCFTSISAGQRILRFHVTDKDYFLFREELCRLLDPLLFVMDAAGELEQLAREHGVFLDNLSAGGVEVVFGGMVSVEGFPVREIIHAMERSSWEELVERAAATSSISLDVITGIGDGNLADDLSLELGIDIGITPVEVVFITTVLP